MLKRIFDPNRFHGARKKKNFFESWYIKITDKENKYSYVFIIGIIKGKIKEEGNTFIHVLDGYNKKTYYLKYPKESFQVLNNPLRIIIDKNFFSLSEIKFSNNDSTLQIVGSLKFIDTIDLSNRRLNSGWHVCIFNGEIIGKLWINSIEMDFTGGKVYIDKTWGKRFLENYIIVQANNFLKSNVALTLLIGNKSLWWFNCKTLIVGFLYGSNIYKFTTFNKSNVKMKFTSNELILTLIHEENQLIVKTIYNPNDFLNLDVVKGNLKVSITSNTSVELIDLYRKRLLFQGVSPLSRWEYKGNIKKVYNDYSL